MNMIAKWFISGFIILNSSFCLAAGITTPLNPANVTPHYPEVTSAPPNIINGRYDTLPLCPTTFNPANCPDINGQGGNPKDCPDYCTVTRNPVSLSVAPDTKRVTNTNVTNPICPTSYVALQTYNMQNEATYDANPPAITPILGMPLYNSYKAAGYSCVMTSTQRTSDKYCSGKYKDGEIVDTINNANGNASFVLNSFKSGCFCSGLSCDDSCDCSLPTSKPRWKYNYYYMQCTPPAGLYLTGNLAPASVVCGRAKTTWNKLTNDAAETTPGE